VTSAIRSVRLCAGPAARARSRPARSLPCNSTSTSTASTGRARARALAVASVGPVVARSQTRADSSAATWSRREGGRSARDPRETSDGRGARHSQRTFLRGLQRLAVSGHEGSHNAMPSDHPDRSRSSDTMTLTGASRSTVPLRSAPGSRVRSRRILPDAILRSARPEDGTGVPQRSTAMYSTPTSH
jgi:hypothetical protein